MEKSEVIKRWEEGENGVQIARAAGRSSHWVYTVLHKSGIVPSAPGRRPKEDHRRKFPIATEQEILRRYEAGEPMTEVAREYGCHAMTVRNIIRRLGGSPRPVGGPRRKWREEELAEILMLHQSGVSQDRIAERFTTTQSQISQLLRNQLGADGVKRKLRNEGRARTVEGYQLVLVPANDPLASMRNVSGYVMEHRLVMARSLGRALSPRETVHHINGDKSDNRLENLQLRAGRHGHGVVRRCRDCGSTNVEEVKIE